MFAFNQTVEDAVKIVCASFEKSVPDETLILHPPAQEINGKKFSESSSQMTPDALKGKIEIEKPNVKFDDIGGQSGAKKEIEGLAFALKNPDLYKKWGTKPPKGIILYGPPGTGKTLIAKALASQADARFFHVEASDIASKWYGESEQIVKSIFELANGTGENTIIFFDEVDAIAPERKGSHEATHRVVSTLLENMDGMASNNNVMVVASTNRLDSIDPALLRAGRFDRWVEVPLPDEEGRKQIFGIHMNKAGEVAGRNLFDNVNLDAIVPKAEKSSGADIAEIIRRTLEEKVRQEGMGMQPGEVTTEDILREMKNYERVKETKRTMGFLAASA
jgi:transitional endoplasmic reticulum ATPase